MKFTIYSIDDSRERYKKIIRHNTLGWEYVDVGTVNGYDPTLLTSAQQTHPYKIDWKAERPPKVGQLGIWYSFLNALYYTPIVTFDDDAIIGPSFKRDFRVRSEELPTDADFFQLFLPRDSDHMYDPSQDVSEHLTRCYSRYGGVGFYLTPKGADRIRMLVSRDGITDQYDNTLYAYSKAGELKGYCSKPHLSDLVWITGKEKSIVQESPDAG